MIRLPDSRTRRPDGPGATALSRLTARIRGRQLSPVVETAIVVLPSALELLTILSFATAWEFAWHTATVAALLLRRRWPLLVFFLTLPVAFNGFLLIAPLAALYQVARQVRRRRTIVFCVLLLFAAGLGPWLPTEEEPFNFEDALFGLLSAAMLSAGPAAMGRLVRTRRELSDRIAELARTQERERELLAERAVVEERARLAREMHDLVSHQVSMISMQAGALQVTSTEPGSQEIGRTIHGLSVSTLEELRHLVGVLRTPRGPQGLGEVAALVESSGLNARLERAAELDELDEVAAPDEAGGVAGWPESVGEAAYRTVQEALTNVRKYAPDAAVTVTLAVERDGPDGARRALLVEVANTRPGRATTCELPTGGHGLTGLRERAALLGGELSAGETADGGFVVRALLPVSLPGPRTADRSEAPASFPEPADAHRE